MNRSISIYRHSYNHKNRFQCLGAVVLILATSLVPTIAFVPLRQQPPQLSCKFSIHTTRQHQLQLQRRREQQLYRHGHVSGPRSSCTSLQMAVAVPTGVAALAGAISGGLFAGGLHAIAGPDHLAALLPRCVGQRWYRASRIGALWGMGHGFSVMLLGVTAFFVKGKISQMGSVQSLLTKATSVTEIAVGLSLVLIGIMGMKEAREWEAENGTTINSDGTVVVHQQKSLSAAAVETDFAPAVVSQSRAVMFNGLLHGFSWDGAPSLAPALAVATWRGNVAFLLAYALGTIGVMTVATTVIGEGTRRAGQVFQRPDLPQKLSFYSSILAVVIGLVWCGMAVAH
ncbi:hypothetical protein MHU86_7109 [Fragilaria crotonensis]|nr:hypothetical protein MHU86_7109 [Fragilaria crotonensis]